MGTIIKPFEKIKPKRDEQKVRAEPQLATAKRDHYTLINGTIQTVDLASNKLKKLKQNHF
jgi:hypothetical protein